MRRGRKGGRREGGRGRERGRKREFGYIMSALVLPRTSVRRLFCLPGSSIQTWCSTTLQEMAVEGMHYA